MSAIPGAPKDRILMREFLNKPKRRWLLAFAFLFLPLIANGVPEVFADGKTAGVPEFTLGSLSVAAGDSVELPMVYGANGADIQPATLVVKIGWNAAWLGLSGVLPGPALTGAGKSVDYELSPTGANVVVFGGTSAIPEGDILRFVFDVLPDALEGAFTAISDQGSNAADGSANAVSMTVSPGQVVVVSGWRPHSADINGDWRISLSELLRVIQFYNTGSLHCQSGTEDNYAPGHGDTLCAPHNSDYSPVDWAVSLNELLRLIQFYNAPSGAYRVMVGSEDGYAPVYAK